MKKLILISIFICLNYFSAYAGMYIDTVLYIKPGLRQSSGQSSDYFPVNIFGPPSSTAGYQVPASAPADLCSIGVGGEIVVGFKNGEIIDGEGIDFKIFENAFLMYDENRIFAEPAKIAVSQDGINFIEFPYDSITLAGCAGKTPTIGNADPFDAQGGGDGFDLAQIGLSSAKYIKITDISLVVTHDKSHKYYSADFLISGFDLDAAAAVNFKFDSSYTDLTSNSEYNVLISKSNMQIVPRNNFIYNIKIFNLSGKQLNSLNDLNGTSNIDISHLNTGMYIVSIEGKHGLETKKIIVSN